MGRAQLLSVLLILPCGLISIGAHSILWGLPDSNPFPLFLVGAILLSIVVHEGLHGIGYYWGGASRSAIEFGFNWDGLAPYAHCAVPLRATQYRWAIALPGIVLGIMPLGISLGLGIWWLSTYAFVMLLAAAGDALLLWMLRSVSSDVWVQDHPTQMGGLVLGHPDSPVPPVLNTAPDEAPSDEAPKDKTSGLSMRTLLLILGGGLLLGLAGGLLFA